MARLRPTLVRKLKQILTETFPAPATVRLEDHDGIIGVITSSSFHGMETIDRQNLICEVVEAHLDPSERRQIQVIVGVTPDEGDGYLAGQD